MDSDTNTCGRKLLKTPSGKTQCPQQVLDQIYGPGSQEAKSKKWQEDWRHFERANSRDVDPVMHRVEQKQQ